MVYVPPVPVVSTDYTDQLVRELCSLGINAEIMPYARWRVLDTSKAIKELQRHTSLTLSIFNIRPSDLDIIWGHSCLLYGETVL